MVTKIGIAAFAIGVLVMGAAVWAMTPGAGQETGGAVTFHKGVLPILQKIARAAIGRARSGQCRC